MPHPSRSAEQAACTPPEVKIEDFNQSCVIPYGLTPLAICQAMNDFVQFLKVINEQLHARQFPRFEHIIMQANFSSLVGEFVGSSIPKHCSTIVRNRYHNGHPDLIPEGSFENDSAQHSSEGIEIKASRYLHGWQGHNPEEVWLLVFCFESNARGDEANQAPAIPFRFLNVYGAKLTQNDWNYSGRSETSRRTITASVNRSGYEKMTRNWIYQAPTS